MAATVYLRVLTGSARHVASGSITGFNFLSSDTYDYSASTRNAYPVTLGNLSFEKALQGYISVSPANKVENFQFWCDGTFMTGTCVLVGTSADAFTTSVSTTSGVATSDMSGFDSGAKVSWDSASYSAVGSIATLLILQLDTNAATGSPGDWTQETFSWSYDEQ